jgi:hypothetical protein
MLDNPLLLLILSFIGAGGGAYFGSYLKKKGGNLATHEDISKLVDQMRAVTQATKEIEAKISNDVWERQRKWEIKREALFEAMKELAGVDYSLAMLDASFLEGRISVEPNSLHFIMTREQAIELWNRALLNFNRAKVLAFLVCGGEVKKAFETVARSIATYADEAIWNKKTSLPKPMLVEHMNALTASVRAELNVE